MMSRVAFTSRRLFSHSTPAPTLRLPNTGALIGNNWVNGEKRFETYNPANEQLLAHVTDSGAKEVNAAFDAAHNAFYTGEYSKMGGYDRSIMLNRLAILIEKNIDELAMLECLDNGKPVSEAKGADLPLVLQCYKYFAGWADKIHGSVLKPGGPFAKGMFAYTDKEPVGIVAAVIPWNFPLLMMAWKIAPAIAAGCSVVLKTAPQTPLTANRIGELMIEAGWPAGAVNIVPGSDETGKLVVGHQGFDKISFTGSTEVGRHIFAAAASSKKMQRVTLELGGKSPLIVCSDANVDAAVATAQVGLFLNQGQCCCASSRILVHKSIYNEFVEKTVKATKTRKVGPGWDPQTSHGPQIDKIQMDRILGLIETGKKQGASLLHGGSRVGDKGFFVAPTVFADCKDDMTIMEEEIFGPVMQIAQYSDDEEAITRANSTQYGLAASVFSRNFTKARSIASRLRAGTIWINTYDTLDAAIPFGGFKASGMGRDCGEAALAGFLETKSVVVGNCD
eukprot:c20331_g1_i1.p1 GENE.c20331_g1_i1~~c20331_g1_i1.p1  ORF type:complete len:506 (-),score=127.57 c20331_g1_i1:118-1635(-)